MTKEEFLKNFMKRHGENTLMMNVPTGSVETCWQWCEESHLFPLKDLLTLVPVIWDENENTFIEG